MHRQFAGAAGRAAIDAVRMQIMTKREIDLRPDPEIAAWRGPAGIARCGAVGAAVPARYAQIAR